MPKVKHSAVVSAAAVTIQKQWRGYLGRQRYFSELLARERNRVKSNKKQIKEKNKNPSSIKPALSPRQSSKLRTYSDDSLDDDDRGKLRPKLIDTNDGDGEEDIIVFRANKKVPVVKASEIQSLTHSMDSLQRDSLSKIKYPPSPARRMSIGDASSDSLDPEEYPLEMIDEEDEFVRDSLANTANRIPTIKIQKQNSNLTPTPSINQYQQSLVLFDSDLKEKEEKSRKSKASPSREVGRSPQRRMEVNDRMQKVPASSRALLEMDTKEDNFVEDIYYHHNPHSDDVDELSPRHLIELREFMDNPPPIEGLEGDEDDDLIFQQRFEEEDEDDVDNDDSLELPIQTIIKKNRPVMKATVNQKTAISPSMKAQPAESERYSAGKQKPPSTHQAPGKFESPVVSPRLAKKTPVSEPTAAIRKAPDSKPASGAPKSQGSNIPRFPSNKRGNQPQSISNGKSPAPKNTPSQPTITPTPPSGDTGSDPLEQIIDREKFERLKRLYEESSSINSMLSPPKPAQPVLSQQHPHPTQVSHQQPPVEVVQPASHANHGLSQQPHHHHQSLPPHSVMPHPSSNAFQPSMAYQSFPGNPPPNMNYHPQYPNPHFYPNNPQFAPSPYPNGNVPFAGYQNYAQPSQFLADDVSQLSDDFSHPHKRISTQQRQHQQPPPHYQQSNPPYQPQRGPPPQPVHSLPKVEESKDSRSVVSGDPSVVSSYAAQYQHQTRQPPSNGPLPSKHPQSNKQQKPPASHNPQPPPSKAQPKVAVKPSEKKGPPNPVRQMVPSSSVELEQQLLKEIAALNQKQHHLINHLFDQPSPQKSVVPGDANNVPMDPSEHPAKKSIAPSQDPTKLRKKEVDPQKQKEKLAFGPAAKDFRGKHKKDSRPAPPQHHKSSVEAEIESVNPAQIVREWQQAAHYDHHQKTGNHHQQHQHPHPSPAKQLRVPPPVNREGPQQSPSRLHSRVDLHPNQPVPFPSQQPQPSGYLQHFDLKQQKQKRSLSAQRVRQKGYDPFDSLSEGGASSKKERVSLPPLVSDQRQLQQQIVAAQGGYHHPLQQNRRVAISSRQSTRSAPPNY